MICGRQRINSNHGMNRGNYLGNVSHVGGSGEPRHHWAEWREDAAQSFRVTLIDLTDFVIVAHVCVRFVTAANFKFRAGGDSACLEAAVYLGANIFQLVNIFCADDIASRGVRWNHIWRFATVRGEAVHAIRGPKMLTKQADGSLRNG